MVSTDIKRLAEDVSYEVFKIFKDGPEKYSLSKFNPYGYFYWNRLISECSYDEAIEVYHKNTTPGACPILLDGKELGIEAVRAISRRFEVFKEIPSLEYYAIFEHFNKKADRWEIFKKCDDMFDYVKMIKTFRNDVNVIVTEYVEYANEDGIIVAGEHERPTRKH